MAARFSPVGDFTKSRRKNLRNGQDWRSQIKILKPKTITHRIHGIHGAGIYANIGGIIYIYIDGKCYHI